MANRTPVRLFIADDHPLLRMGLSLAFHVKDDLKVVGESDNGFDAIEKIKHLEPDVALLDIDMPGLSGTAAIRILRKLYPDMTLLALSTYNDKNYIRDTMNAGADGYILKSVDIDNLVRIIVGFHENNEIISPYLLNLSMDLSEDEYEEDSSTIPLTKREMEILNCLADGKDNKEISANLYLSVETVKTHMKNIFRKLNVKNRLEAVIRAQKQHLID